jgi:hypothetical protein
MSTVQIQQFFAVSRGSTAVCGARTCFVIVSGILFSCNVLGGHCVHDLRVPTKHLRKSVGCQCQLCCTSMAVYVARYYLSGGSSITLGLVVY